MKIGIIGAGFTGLTAALELLKGGHEVIIFEKDSAPGGLAIGYKEKAWEWSLEYHYHHWFTNDDHILGLAQEIGYEVIIKRPKTSVRIDHVSYQLDSPIAWLTFPRLNIFERVRMAAVFAILFRFNPFWRPLEKFKIIDVLPKLIGQKAYKIIWEPQLLNKYGSYISEISLVWFWARIIKRTPSLAYPNGGFLAFAEYVAAKVLEKKGQILYGAEVIAIHDDSTATVTIQNKSGKKTTYELDRVIVTLPTPHFLKVTPQLPDTYREKMKKLRGIGATNMVIRLKEQFMQDNTYWLSICDTKAQIMVIVEHTNFMDKKHYNNEHILYVGNYMPITDERFAMDKEKLLALYNPFLEKINPSYKKSIIGYEVFRSPFAQPLVPINYSKIIPPLETPLQHVFLANIQQVYPWDRGTNYAVELGKNVAQKII
jgi:protoporphyrinogen oxidase